MNTIRNKLRNRKMTYGSWLTIPHEASAEIMAKAGFEWLVIDMEHSPIGVEAASRLIRVIDLCGLPALCRLPCNDPVLAKNVLDAGARGIIVPKIESRDEAIQAVEAVHYPPKGQRGVGLGRAQAYGSGFANYKDYVEKDLIVIAMIETVKGIKNIESIAKTTGIDGLLIGPYDLSASLGFIGKLDHPEMHKALTRIIQAAREADIGCGLHVVQPEKDETALAIQQGYTFLALGVDMIFIHQAASRALNEAKSGIGS